MDVQGLGEQGVRWGHPQPMPETLIGIVLADQRVHGLPVYGAGLKGQTVFLASEPLLQDPGVPLMS